MIGEPGCCGGWFSGAGITDSTAWGAVSTCGCSGGSALGVAGVEHVADEVAIVVGI